MMLKRMGNEDEETHKNRVKMYLLACPDTKFSNIADIIDPSKVQHEGFFMVYNECTEIRA